MRHEAELTKAIEKRLGDGYEVVPHESHKENGIVLNGFSIREKSHSIGTVVYVDDYVDRIGIGKMTVDQAADMVVNIFWKNKPSKSIDVSELNKAEILGHVLPRMTAYAGNKGFLEGLLYRKVLDIAVIYRYPVRSLPGGSINITKQLAKHFGITEADLFKAATENARICEGYYIQDLGEMMAGMMGTARNENEGSGGLYIITSRDTVFGAASILQERVLDAASKICEGSFYILPSSVHEILAVPEYMVDDPEELKLMVDDCNRTVVDRQERLSNSVYKYNDRLKVVEFA